MATAPLRGLIFDKDGTLFDFNATWGAWSRQMLTEEADGDADVLAALSDVLGYDLATDSFRPGSIVIAETVDVVADHIRIVLPQRDKAALIARMNAAATEVPQIAAANLPELIANLRAGGLRLGVATNDAEAPARQHLRRAAIEDQFELILGSDSGHGGKPAPGQLLAFCAQTGIAPVECAMVGDSLHDLHAGRAAGMMTIAVLTGPALAAELAPQADVVLNSIAEIPDWLSVAT